MSSASIPICALHMRIALYSCYTLKEDTFKRARLENMGCARGAMWSTGSGFIKRTIQKLAEREFVRSGLVRVCGKELFIPWQIYFREPENILEEQEFVRRPAMSGIKQSGKVERLVGICLARRTRV